MPDELDDLIRAAGAEVGPGPDATERARGAAVRAASGRGLRRLLRSRRGRTGAIVLGLVLAGGGATAATVGVLADRGGDGPPWRPLPQNCFALDGYALHIPPLGTSVHASGAATTVVWVTGDGIVTAADRRDDGAFGDPVQLSAAAGEHLRPREAALAGNARGDLAVAWWRADVVQVSVRPADGTWSPPHTVTPDGRASALAGVEVAVAPDGRVAVGAGDVDRSAFERLPGGATVIRGAAPVPRVALGDVRGTWDVSTVLDDADALLAQAPALAFDAAGGLIAVTPEGRGVAVRALDARTGEVVPGSRRVLRAPAPPSAISGATTFSGPVAASGPAGEVAVAWSRNGYVTAAVRSAKGAWGRATRVSRPGAEAYDARVAVGGGTVAVAWTAVARSPEPGRPGLRSRTVMVATRPTAGRWREAVALSRPRQIVAAPAVSVGAEGEATVVWALGTNGISGRDSRVQSSTLAPGDADWGAAQTVSETGLGPLAPAVAATGAGGGVATWSRCDGRRRGEPRTSSRSGGAWSPPVTVAP